MMFDRAAACDEKHLDFKLFKSFKLFNLEYGKIVYCFDFEATFKCLMHNLKIIAWREDFIAWKSISGSLNARGCQMEFYERSNLARK